MLYSKSIKVQRKHLHKLSVVKEDNKDSGGATSIFIELELQYLTTVSLLFEITSHWRHVGRLKMMRKEIRVNENLRVFI